MSSETATPDNLISIHQLQCDSLKQKIAEIEGRVVELETDLLEHATVLNDTISRELEFLVESEVIEFDCFSGDQGVVNKTDAPEEGQAWIHYSDTADQVSSTLDSARQKLEYLNQKIDQLELPS